MPLPGGLQTVTVTGQYQHPGGTAMKGSVTFTPEPAVLTAAAVGDILLGPTSVTLDATGVFTVTLLATDATGVTPTGWTYTVTESFTDAAGRSYPISLPAAAPTVSLPAVAPTAPAAGTYVVVTGPAGASVKTAQAYITSGDIALPASPSLWTLLPTASVSIAAVVGDRIAFGSSGMHSLNSNYIDWALLNNTGTAALYASTGTNTPASEGDPAWYPQAGSFPGHAGPVYFTVQAGHISGGMVTVRAATKGAGAGTLYAGTTYPLRLTLANYGP